MASDDLETWERRDDSEIFRRCSFAPTGPVMVDVELWRIILRELGFAKVKPRTGARER